MSYSFDGINDKLSGTFTSTYPLPVTVACFIKVTNHPVANQAIVMLGNSDANPDSVQIRTDTADNGWEATSQNSGGSAQSATVAGLNLDGVWAALVGTFTSSTLRDMYAQSISNTDTDTVSNIVAGALQFLRVGESLAESRRFDGLIAEVAIWDVALSSANITSYMGGTAASSIDSGNLIGYWPLSASNSTQNNLGVDAGGDLTVTGATFDSSHPTITSGGLVLPFSGKLGGLFVGRF